MIEPLARFELFGNVPSKKNKMMPRKKGGGRGMFLPKALKEEIERVAGQVPLEFTRLGMTHVDIEIEWSFPVDTEYHKPWQSDGDGKLTTLMDIFVKLGTFVDDKFATCNGHKYIHPATVSTEIDKITISFWNNGDLPKSIAERYREPVQ